jgi:hypothetical protein
MGFLTKIIYIYILQELSIQRCKILNKFERVSNVLKQNIAIIEYAQNG